MSVITDFPTILQESKTEYEQARQAVYGGWEGAGQGENLSQRENLLALGDNLKFMAALLNNEAMAGKIQMVYIDPPFFSKANYDAVIKIGAAGGTGGKTGGSSLKHPAYEDMWKKGMSQYLKMLGSRLYMIRDLLAETGTLWVHLDWHVAHYAKVLLDEIFCEEGRGQFINEIIWTYKSGGSSKNHFSRKHDTILVYGKTKKYFLRPPREKSYNRDFKPYRFKGVEEFEDETGWYTMVNMKDVWQIDMVGRTAAERTGYATQKPEALLSRIIECSTITGDLCADFFCGSGTLAVTAEKLGRRWICGDMSRLAVGNTLTRLCQGGIEVRKKIKIIDIDGCVKVGENQGTDGLSAAIECNNHENGKVSFKVILTAYDPAGTFDELEEKDRRLLEKAAAEDSLQLIQYWSVDFDFDGITYKPEAVFTRSKDGLETACERIFAGGSNVKGPRKIAVRAIDLLGNWAVKVFDISEEV